MSAIIDNAETIRYQRQVSIAQTKSQSGVRQAQRRGPLLYNFYVEIRPLRFGSIAYFAIEDEILDLNYSTATTSVTGGTQILLGNLTTQRGLWSGTHVVAATGDVTGNEIDILITDLSTSNSITNYGRKGDFVQFAGYTKVYQLTANVNTVSTSATTATATLPLNGAVPATEDITGDTVRRGPEVMFNLQLKERPEPEFSLLDTVHYSSATFEEVL